MMTENTEPVLFTLDWSMFGIINLLSNYEFETVLDIGSGAGEQARFMRHFGKKVYTIDISKDADYVGDFMDVKIDRKFDVVFCSHVLEHQRNVGAFLEKIYDCLDENAILMLAVPVHPRSTLIGGHLTNWNAGLLIYNLIYSGFDCSKAKFLHTYDLNLIVRKAPAVGSEIRSSSVVDYCLGPDSSEDQFSYVQKYFPFPVKHGGNCEIQALNWERQCKLPFKPGMRPVKISNRFVNLENVVLSEEQPIFSIG